MDFSDGVRRRQQPKEGFKLFDDDQTIEEDEKKPLFSELPKKSSFKFFTLKNLSIILIILLILTLGLYFVYKKTSIFSSVNHVEATDHLVQKPAIHYDVDGKKLPPSPNKEEKKPIPPKKVRKPKKDDEEEEDEEEEDDEEFEKKRKARLEKKKLKLEEKKKRLEEKRKKKEQLRQQKLKQAEEKRRQEEEKKKQEKEAPKQEDVQVKTVEKPIVTEKKVDFDHDKFEQEKNRVSTPKETPIQAPKPPQAKKEVVLKEIEPKSFKLETIPDKKSFFKYVIDDYQEGKLPKGLPLIYFSSNHDLNIPFKGDKKYLTYQEELYKYIENDNYIMPLVYYGFISKIIWVKHSTSHQIPTGTYTVNIGNVEGTEQLAVDRKDIFEFFASWSPKLKNPKLVTIQVIELTEWYSKKPNTKSYEELISIPGEKNLLPPILYANLDYFDFQNPATGILHELKIDNVDPFIRWKEASNYCLEKQEDSEKVYKFINSIFQAERRYQKVKILDLAKNVIPLWCKGKEKAEEYFKNLDSLLAKDIRLLTPITRGDLAYHHHTEDELEGMIKKWLGFVNEIYSLKQLQLVPNRPRRPNLAVLAVKPYHTKPLLSLIHRLVADLFQSPFDNEIHDSDELPSKPQGSKKESLKEQKPKKVYKPRRQRRQRRRRDDDDDDEDDEEDEEEEERRRRKKNDKKNEKKNEKKPMNYNTEDVKKRLDYLLNEVNNKPILKGGSNKK